MTLQHTQTTLQMTLQYAIKRRCNLQLTLQLAKDAAIHSNETTNDAATHLQMKLQLTLQHTIKRHCNLQRTLQYTQTTLQMTLQHTCNTPATHLQMTLQLANHRVNHARAAWMRAPLPAV